MAIWKNLKIMVQLDLRNLREFYKYSVLFKNLTYWDDKIMKCYTYPSKIPIKKLYLKYKRKEVINKNDKIKRKLIMLMSGLAA